MIRFENNCLHCDYCVNCGADHQAIFICDECGDEVDTLYHLDGEQVCGDCALKILPEVDIYD